MLEWRSGTEKDLDNVLQVPSIFLNVSKGQLAPKEDLIKAFGKDKSEEEIVLEILRKGELQVGEKERKEGMERMQRAVVEIVAGKLVEPKSLRVYTPGMIERALDMLSKEAAQAKQEDDKDKGSGTGTPAGEDGTVKKRDLPSWSGVVTNKSAKSQALEAMKALIAWQVIPVMRARMRLRIVCHVSQLKQAVKVAVASTDADEEGAEKEKKGTVKDRILSYVEEVESQGENSGEWEVVGFVEPGAFKGLSDFISGETKGKGRVEVLDMAVVHEKD